MKQALPTVVAALVFTNCSLDLHKAERDGTILILLVLAIVFVSWLIGKIKSLTNRTVCGHCNAHMLLNIPSVIRQTTNWTLECSGVIGFDVNLENSRLIRVMKRRINL